MCVNTVIVGSRLSQLLERSVPLVFDSKVESNLNVASGLA